MKQLTIIIVTTYACAAAARYAEEAENDCLGDIDCRASNDSSWMVLLALIAFWACWILYVKWAQNKELKKKLNARLIELKEKINDYSKNDTVTFYGYGNYTEPSQPYIDRFKKEIIEIEAKLSVL
jgi:hypothetical protein